MEINKVLYFSYDGILDPLGSSQIVPYLTGLSKKDKKMTVITFEKKRNLLNNTKVILLKNELDSLGIEWIPLRYHKTPVVFSTIFDIFSGFITSLQAVTKERIRIVHARSYVSGMIALALKFLCGVHIIFDMRGFWVDERVEGGIWKKDGFLYLIGKYFERQLISKSDEIIVLTQASKAAIEGFSYLKNSSKNITVIPTCVDLGLFSGAREKNRNIHSGKSLDKEFILTYAGSLSTWYMYDEMLNFFKVLRSSTPDSHFLVLTNDQDFLRKRPQDDMEDVTFKSVEHNLIPEYLLLAKAGIAFYKPGYSRKACCPTKLGEYLASGIPVIINSGIGDSDGYILKERVGVVINDFSIDEYKRAADELKLLFAEGSNLGNRCRKVAEKHLSIDIGIHNYERIYERLYLS